MRKAVKLNLHGRSSDLILVRRSHSYALLALAATLGWLALTACQSGGCAVQGKVERLIAQLQGRCCEFTTEPTSDRPDNSCKLREPGLLAAFTVRHADRECIRAAAGCLGEMGRAAAPASVPALIAALENGPNNYDTGDGIIAVRDAVVEALGQTGDARALPAIIRALENPKPVESGPGAAGYTSQEPPGEVAALNALAALGRAAAPAVPRVLPLLKRRTDSSEGLRIVQAAARALAAIGDASAVPALIGALDHEEAAAIEVAKALAAFGSAAEAALPRLAAGPDNRHFREAIRKIRRQ